ncbi:hypothetical protein BDR22DRAFT_895270 [Usnea florida]
MFQPFHTTDALRLPLEPLFGYKIERHKIIPAFGEALLKENMFKKLFDKQTPGKRIALPQTGNNDSKYQLRIDAGEEVEVVDAVDEGRKNEEMDKGGKGKGGRGSIDVFVA